MIDRAVTKAGFRRYSPTVANLSPAAAAAAAEAFFASGSLRAAERQAEASLGHADELAEIAGDLLYSRTISSLAVAVREAVLDRFPTASPEDVAGRVAAAMSDEVYESISAADRSRPIDAFEGSEVVACYVPGLAEAGLAGTMTDFWTDESSSLTVKPDAAFMRFLELANVSVDGWIEAVRKGTGQRIDEGGPEAWQEERARAWRNAECRHDESRGPLAKPSRLVQAVDACYLGFTPMIAFNGNVRHLCSRDWSLPLSLKGGILGLHDFLNGSGDPVRFEQKATLEARPGDMMLGEGRSCDFGEVHGFVRSSFRSRVSDGQAAAPDEAEAFTPGM